MVQPSYFLIPALAFVISVLFALATHDELKEKNRIGALIFMVNSIFTMWLAIITMVKQFIHN